MSQHAGQKQRMGSGDGTSGQMSTQIFHSNNSGFQPGNSSTCALRSSINNRKHAGKIHIHQCEALTLIQHLIIAAPGTVEAMLSCSISKYTRGMIARVANKGERKKGTFAAPQPQLVFSRAWRACSSCHPLKHAQNSLICMLAMHSCLFPVLNCRNLPAACIEANQRNAAAGAAQPCQPDQQTCCWHYMMLYLSL